MVLRFVKWSDPSWLVPTVLCPCRGKSRSAVQRRQSKLPEIIELMKTGTSAPGEVSGLISIEFAGLCTEIRECKSDSELLAYGRENSKRFVC